jgi:hypothetical protein
MIYDYYNIICFNCNHRLLNTLNRKLYGSDCFLAHCNCNENYRTTLYIYNDHLIFRSSGKFLFSFRYYDCNFNSRLISIDKILYSLINKDTLDNVFDTTTLSHICLYFLEILNRYNNNLIFI